MRPIAFEIIAFILFFLEPLCSISFASLPVIPGIDYYEPLNFDNVKATRLRRSAQVRKQSTIWVSTHGYNFTLLLEPDNSVITDTSLLTVGAETRKLTHDAVKGTVLGYPGSFVYGSLIANNFRGTVQPFQDDDSKQFVIEPSGNFFKFSVPFHSIVYSYTSLNRRKRSIFDSEDFPHCGLSHKNIRDQMNINYSDARNMKRKKRSIRDFLPPRLSLNNGSSSEASSRVCNLFLQSDTYLWDHVISLSHVKRDKELAIKEITSIFTSHVQAAQLIFQRAVFHDFRGRISYMGVTFRVDRVRINVTEVDCKPRSGLMNRDGNISRKLPPSASPSSYSVERGSDDNPFCDPNIDVSNFLNLISYQAHDDFCLAYLFTFRDFSSGTLGLAWVAQPEGSGGICEKYRAVRIGTNRIYRSLNTGVVTLMNYGAQVALKVSQLTFTHEIGHNFGAKHDDDHKSEHPECLPSVDDPKGNYIMFASATSGDKANNNKFSVCSLDSIARLLDSVHNSGETCFLASDGPFCGNRLLEKGEQCDCGFSEKECEDQCCQPNDSPNPCQLKDFVFFRGKKQKVHCSPTAGKCCRHDCTFRPEKELCIAGSECHEPSYCTGGSFSCPPPEPFADGTPCQNHTRVCKAGQCIGSICERIPGWSECSLELGPNVSREKMCYVSCRPNSTITMSLWEQARNNSVAALSDSPLSVPCISTYDLERDVALRSRFSDLARELLRGQKGIQFRPGMPCDNYRGYCDAFLQCQLHDDQGPLERLKNLLFSPQVLKEIQYWITVHWWAIIFFVVASIIAMVVFVKLCSYSHPSITMPGNSIVVGPVHGRRRLPRIWRIHPAQTALQRGPNPTHLIASTTGLSAAAIPLSTAHSTRPGHKKHRRIRAEFVHAEHFVGPPHKRKKRRSGRDNSEAQRIMLVARDEAIPAVSPEMNIIQLDEDNATLVDLQMPEIIVGASTGIESAGSTHDTVLLLEPSGRPRSQYYSRPPDVGSPPPYSEL
ncbi:hypothetical protein Ciccas_004365 [Cichlidogyrus casuarinus]|uniref:ADAM10 endopeptidase n=1 Tax=Cichlidogyrus casuarinus TaxID=1844966 RepID=A0ABD2QF73_9PLAT